MADDSNGDDPFITPEPMSTTSGLPPRKRRRPALSCEQCRKRKIKCDRNYPCNHCIQSKTAICTYSSDNTTAHALEVASTIGTNSTIAFPNRPKKNPSSIASSTNTSSNTTSPKATATTDGSSTSYHSPNTDPNVDDGSSRQALLERIHDLEGQLANKADENEEFNNPSAVLVPSLSGAPLGPDMYEGKNLRGTVSKTRFFGQSHWMYSYGAFERIACMTVDPQKNVPDFHPDIDTQQVKELLDKCKSMARAAKVAPHKQWLLNPNFRESIPSREISDQLVDLYFRTSESIYRILHVPTFRLEYIQYWNNPAAASTVFLMKLILVLSIGACFYQGPNAKSYHNQALQWIFAAQSWLSTPFEKGRLHISGVQIQCLVLLARLDNAVAGDLVWISAGALLRIAFQMGFHRDPKYLPPMSQLHAELRRRLWATIVEINVQSSLDSGMPPLFSLEDSDTEPPANINDVDLNEGMGVRAAPQPAEIYTQTSVQRLLFSTVLQRLEIVRQANSVRLDPTYDEALALGAQLTKAMKSNNAFITRINSTSPPGTPPPISQLQRNLLDLSVRRFLLSLHRPFAAKAATDPRYYFSRKICLDCSTTMVSYPSSNVTDAADSADVIASPDYRDDFTWLKTMSGGFQKGFIIHAVMVIFSELLLQIEEDDGSSTTASAATREPLKQLLRDIIELAAERIRLVENNVKGHLCICIVLAQVEAIEKGISIEEPVILAAKKSLNLCLELLKERIRKSISAEEYAALINSGDVAPMKVFGNKGARGDGMESNNEVDGAGVSNSSGDAFGTGKGVTAPLPNTLPNGFNFGFGFGMGVTGQEWGADFGMQDWNSSGSMTGVDGDFAMPDSWLLNWEDGNIF